MFNESDFGFDSDQFSIEDNSYSSGNNMNRLTSLLGRSTLPLGNISPEDLTKLNGRLKEQFEQRNNDIVIPENIAAKVVEGINFAIKNNAARAVDGSDLYHVHLCTPQERIDQSSPDWGGLKGDSKIVLEKLAVDPNTSLLFHSQECVNQANKNRNIVITGLEGGPVIVPSLKGTEGIGPNDLHTFSPLDLRFIQDPDGRYTLEDGTKINIFLYEYPRNNL